MDWVIVIKEGRTYYRGGAKYSVGQTAQDALENWKKYKSDEADESRYKYLGIISLEEANKNGYHNTRPGFDRWVDDFFLPWIEQGNFIPLNGIPVRLEDSGGRLHLSVGPM